MAETRPPLVLIVLDGWGLRQDHDHNAIALAETPTFKELLEQYPNSALVTSGKPVGLPADQMGNSEVGHMNLGAGRVVYQDLTRIDQDIAEGNFFQNPTLLTAMCRCSNSKNALHLVGLVSDGGVHSHIHHLEALLRMARSQNVSRVFVHAFTDGRDSSPNGGTTYLGLLEELMSNLRVGRIASVTGRYYAMDRDRRWDRTEQAYDAMVLGEGRTSDNPLALLSESYKENVTDEFIKPGVVVDSAGQPIGTLNDGDSLVFFNYRADRARQLTQALAFDKFEGFTRKKHPKTSVTTITEYDAKYGLPVAYSPQEFSSSLAMVIADHGLRNLRLAETEKYAHVTYFFNCGEERPYRGEERILVPSPKVPTYDLKPQMRAHAITEHLVADVSNRRHEVVVCNFANADMVGHTGNLDAAITAVSTLDSCLLRIVQAVEKVHGTIVITSDHGPHTAHTTNMVPVILVNRDIRGKHLDLAQGSLRDIAPTMLGILGIQPPTEMTGHDLRNWVNTEKS